MNNEFSGLWKGGYYEGDPLDPKGNSTYDNNSFMSILHATYLRCIKPYMNSEINVLEIGPGRGAWTSCMLEAGGLWCIDVLPLEETKFPYASRYNVNYIQVSDYSLKELPEKCFDFVFSFGCLCHVPPAGVKEYAENMYSKLEVGADIFWMISDDEKFFAATGQHISEVGPGHWYAHGIDNTCKMLEEIGYKVVDPDVGTNLRDPIIYFRKEG
jgi:cyclopropane fatty-acyl-phospholipid synthase-like methyltransferase